MTNVAYMYHLLHMTMVSTIRNIPAMIQAMIIPAITPPVNMSDDDDESAVTMVIQ